MAWWLVWEMERLNLLLHLFLEDENLVGQFGL